jgi:APA family basic amino acid/polyamine antiporter
MSEESRKLRKSLGMFTMVSLSAGAVIGGWIVEAPYWFSLTGAGSMFVFPVLALFLVPVGLAFAEISAMLPFASSVSGWTANAIGQKTGWLTQWLMFLIQIVEPPLMAYIIVTILSYFFPGIAEYQVLAACAFCVLWYIFSNFVVGVTGILANIFFILMILLAIVVAASFFSSSTWSLSNITGKGGFFPLGGRGIFVAFAVFSLKFIGFEMTPTLVEEMKFPIKKLWMVILVSLFFPALLYAFVVFGMAGMIPWDSLKDMTMPEPEIIAKFGLPGILALFAIIAGFLHALTTMMGFWTSSARVLYGSAQMNQLPKAMYRLNRYGQPWISNIAVLAFSIFFCIFSSTNWVQYIYAVSCIAAGLVYAIVCIDVLILRKKHPEWPRPYKAPIGNPVLVFGVLVSLWIVIGSCLELSAAGYVSLLIYVLIGVIVYLVMDILRKKHPGRYDQILLTPADIGKENAVSQEA